MAKHDRPLLARRLALLPEPFTTEDAMTATGVSHNGIRPLLRSMGFLAARHPLDRRRQLWATTEASFGIDEAPSLRPRQIVQPVIYPHEVAEPEPARAPDTQSTSETLTIRHEQTVGPRGWQIAVPDELRQMADAMRLGIEVRVWPLDG